MWNRLGFAALAVAISLLFVGCGEEKKPAPQGPTGAGTSQAAPSGGGAVEDTIVKGEARDVVCNMAVKAEGSREFVYKNTRFHFCSDDCLTKFKADPSKMATGLPGEECVCSRGGMKNCKCGHCTGKQERCDCNDPGKGEEHEHGEHEGHEHH